MSSLHTVKILRWVYLGIFLISFGSIILLHIVPKPFLDVIRMPTFIRTAQLYLGFPYGSSLLIYQIALLTFLATTLLNCVSLFFFSSGLMKKISAFTSLAGIILMSIVGLYFLYSLVMIGVASVLTKTVLVYLTASFLLSAIYLFTLWVGGKPTLFFYKNIYQTKRNLI
ncbi:MAG TPA: hypothetical protein VF303_04310 [Candidatus Nanoarchaeia archaeon]